MKSFESEYYFIAFHLTGYTLVSPTEVRDTLHSLINSTAGRNSAILLIDRIFGIGQELACN